MSNVSECIESGEMVGECRANVSSPGKVGWPMSVNVSSPANFPKWPFWRVLEFDKFAGEWPLLSYSSNLFNIPC